jgi:hypothetical protein
MAKIQTENVVITFSKLTRDSENQSEPIISADVATALEQVAQELAGAGVIVEVQLA